MCWEIIPNNFYVFHISVFENMGFHVCVPKQVLFDLSLNFYYPMYYLHYFLGVIHGQWDWGGGWDGQGALAPLINWLGADFPPPLNSKKANNSNSWIENLREGGEVITNFTNFHCVPKKFFFVQPMLYWGKKMEKSETSCMHLRKT